MDKESLIKKNKDSQNLKNFLNKKNDEELLYEYIGKKENKDDIINEYLNREKPILNNYAKKDIYTKRGSLKYGDTRRLKLYNPHTKEKFNKVYYSNGKYKKRVIEDLYYFMRDFREKQILPIDTELVNMMYSMQKVHSPTKPLNLLSGYRTYKTNKKVGGAKHSQHMNGKAVDLSPSNTSLVILKRMQKHALNSKIGGVGLYKRKRFLHIDTGNVRQWLG